MNKANDAEDASGGPIAGDWPKSLTWAIRQYEGAMRRLQDQIGDTDIDAASADVAVADDPVVMVLLEETAYWGVLVLVAKELAGPR